ncbi:MAG: hypothetical protein LBG15_00385 [Dysgonamonadaceae bacterium]|jgi:hypothetical protein|nr:hypothetical protein [Dysgonamonadaceae bacterium]
MKFKYLLIINFLIFSPFLIVQAEVKDTTTAVTPLKHRFTLGGYGEAIAQRMFYSDNVARYMYPESNKDATHGRFDLPHVVVYMAYDFGKGWKFSSEIEFEHGGSGSTFEIEKEETGEYETEIEKGGEVVLEQFWIEKTFSDEANLRIGHIIVPIGLTNQYHLPTDFFSALRPEEETAILPCTWHQTGISFWGKTKHWRYEAQFLSGLDAERFSNAGWIKEGAISPYEFEIANSYAGALRVDNYSVPGLRIGLSGYYGYSAQNSLKWERYKNQNVKGAVSIGALDAVYNDYNLLARGNVIYGHLVNSYAISMINKKLPSASPSPRTDVASDVLSYYVEAGYDLFSFFPKFRNKQEKLYVYGHYGFYDSMYKTDKRIAAKDWTKKTIISGGINYYPLKEIVVKAEYSFRKFSALYNNEPTFSLGIAYAGLFK